MLCRPGTAVWRFVVWRTVISPSQGPISLVDPCCTVVWRKGEPEMGGGWFAEPASWGFCYLIFYDKYEPAAAIEWRDTIWLAITVFGVIFYKFLSLWGQYYKTIETTLCRPSPVITSLLDVISDRWAGRSWRSIMEFIPHWMTGLEWHSDTANKGYRVEGSIAQR